MLRGRALAFGGAAAGDSGTPSNTAPTSVLATAASAATSLVAKNAAAAAATSLLRKRYGTSAACRQGVQGVLCRILEQLARPLGACALSLQPVGVSASSLGCHCKQYQLKAMAQTLYRDGAVRQVGAQGLPGGAC